MPKFRVELVGSFFTYELYDSRGREVTNLQDAIDAAESVYGTNWQCVYNGNEGAEREG